MRAHQAALSDEALVIAEVFVGPNANQLRPNNAVAAIVAGSEAACALVGQRARARERPALDLAAWIDLPAEDDALRALCVERTEQALAAGEATRAEREKQAGGEKGEVVMHLGVRQDEIAQIAAFADPAARAQLARDLVADFLATDSDEPSRAGALRSLDYLSGALEVDVARELMAALLSVAGGDYAPCAIGPGGQDLELDDAGRERHSSGQLQGTALAACARLAAVAGDEPEPLAVLAAEGLYASQPVVRAGALAIYQELPTLPLPPGVDALLGDSEPLVRSSTLRMLVARDPDALADARIVALARVPKGLPDSRSRHVHRSDRGLSRRRRARHIRVQPAADGLNWPHPPLRQPARPTRQD